MTWIRAFSVVVAGLAALSLAGCSGPGPSPPLGPRPSLPPNAGPGVAADGETAAEAALRLFPAAYGWQLEWMDQPGVLEGVTPGAPTPVSEDYGHYDMLVRWVLPDDVDSVSGSMFAAMWPSAMSKTRFLVPMVKHGRSVCEFGVYLDDSGRWADGGTALDPVPAGVVYELQTATVKLKAWLGQRARVRPVMFLPSGLEFAVGDNHGREAAVFLGCVNSGKGVGSFDKRLPESGRLFTPAELKELLMP